MNENMSEKSGKNMSEKSGKAMSGGFFIKLASNNIRKNKRIYTPYIVTCISMVMMFYIIMNLAMDPEVATFHKGAYVQLILNLGVYVVGIFVLIFLFYTNSFLMKRRQTELGLYSVLGMGKRHIVRVLAWETVIVWVESVVLGLISGIVFSKLAQVGLIRLLGGGINYTFTVNVKVMLQTAALFAGVFVLIYVKSAFEVFRMNTIDLLYGAGKGEKEPKANFLLALAGVICLGGGYFIAMKVDNPIYAILLFFVAVILVILGTYACMISGSVTLLTGLKRNKNYFYKTNHFISTGSMIFRMKKHGAGLASICILSTMVLVMLSSTACLYFGSEDSREKCYPRDLEVEVNLAGTDEKTLEASSESLDEMINKAAEEIGVTKLKLLKYTVCDAYGEIAGSELKTVGDINAETELVLLPVEDYNSNLQKGQKPLDLKSDEIMIKCQNMDYDEPVLSIAGKEYKVVGEVEDLVMRGADAAAIGPLMYVVVPDKTPMMALNDLALKNSQGGSGTYPTLVNYYGFNVLGDDGTTGNQELISQVENAINDLYDTEAKNGFYGENPTYVYSRFFVRTVISSDELFGFYGGLFFLGIMLSILFIGAMILIMYYKQVSEGYDDRDRFAILRKVGMANGDVKKSIRYQVLTVFFVPLLGAGLHMAFAFKMISLMIRTFAISNIELLAFTTLGAFAIFAVLYVAAYAITSKAYYKMVSAA